MRVFSLVLAEICIVVSTGRRWRNVNCLEIRPFHSAHNWRVNVPPQLNCWVPVRRRPFLTERAQGASMSLDTPTALLVVFKIPTTFSHLAIYSITIMRGRSLDVDFERGAGSCFEQAKLVHHSQRCPAVRAGEQSKYIEISN